MAALGVEVAHHHYRATLAAAGVKRGKLPQPLRLDRPTPWVAEPVPTTTKPAPRQSAATRADGRRPATTVAEVVAALAHGIKRG